jgi:RNA polymerase sigma-70 factor, ECF subfamily
MTDMSPQPELELTHLLNRFADGDAAAENELVPFIQAELHKMAVRNLRSERRGHTLQPTALVHEVYMRMVGRKTAWAGRVHFFSVAAHVMRGVLVDYARQRQAQKRGGTAVIVPLNEAFVFTEDKCELVLYVNDALLKLAKLDERQAKVVEMRFFADMTEEEIALVLGVSSKTVKRDWAMAKAWLAATLSEGGQLPASAG